MSQVYQMRNDIFPPGSVVQTIEGNVGGPISPDPDNNIFIVGAGIVLVTGDEPTNTLTITITNPIPIANGGTNATSYSTVDGTLYYDGTRFITTAIGTDGQVLTSNGPGLPPSYEDLPDSGVVDIDGDTGTATGPTITVFADNANQNCGSSVLFEASAAQVLLNVTDNLLNTIIGFDAGNAAITGTDNVSLGTNNLQDLTTGTGNVFVGNGSGQHIQDGSQNVGIGFNCVGNSVSGNNNIGIGVSCLTANGTSNNIAIGSGVMASASNSGHNVAIGPVQCFTAAQTANQNVVIGSLSGRSMTNATNNTAVGYDCLSSNISGSNNIAIGKNAMYQNNSCNNSIAIGANAYPSDTGGAQNTMIGDGCASSLTGGANLNIIIGANAGNGLTTTDSENIMIGAVGVAGDNNVTRIGYINGTASTQTECYIDGIASVSVGNQEMVTIDTTTGQMGSEPLPTGDVSGPGSSTDRAIATWNGTGGDTLFNNSSAIIDSSGRMTNTSQPAFSAYLNASDVNVTGNGTNYRLGQGTALTEDFDQGGDFNTNGNFTAPVDGKYRFTFAILLQQCATATNTDIQVLTSNYSVRGNQENPSAVNVSGSWGFFFPCFVNMDAGDTASANINVSGVGADTCDVYGGAGDRRSWFSGNLVC